jgi:hypothetical protein
MRGSSVLTLKPPRYLFWAYEAVEHEAGGYAEIARLLGYILVALKKG